VEPVTTSLRARLASSCVGRPRCSVVSNDVGWMHSCRGVADYVQVVYQCIPSQSHISLSASKGKGSLYSITERRVPELIPVLGSQPAGDASHKPGGRLPVLFARPAVTLTTLKRAATNFAAW